VSGDGFRNALAAGQAGADELERVAPVGLGTARADGIATVAARLVDHPVGQVVGVNVGGDLAGRGVDVAERAAQQDGTGAGGGGPGVRQPRFVGVRADGGGGERHLAQARIIGESGALLD
jgi:hypothetical protein